ncbi:MAG: glutamine amidotransferase, partial [Bryobacteraceae bacterium]
NYGRGRTAVFATAGSWRWQMLQPVTDMSDELFWRQFLRWLVADTPGRVIASTQHNGLIEDDKQVSLRAEVRDISYLPASDAQVTARITGPDGQQQSVALTPDEHRPGVSSAAFEAAKTGSYAAEVVAARASGELGRGVTVFHREDGQAENFHQEQNRALLEKLASETGGRYYTASDANQLASDITFSDAGIGVRETRDLWDMPAAFFLALLLCCSEWLLRRRWGVV